MDSRYYRTHGSATTHTYGYDSAPGYAYPSSQQAPASGYSYMPHSATTQERDSRMRGVRARKVPYPQSAQYGSFEPEAYRPHPGSRVAGVYTPASKSPSPEPPAKTHSSSEEESNGPRTPYSRDRFVWKDSHDEVPEQEHLGQPHPQGRKDHHGSYKYYPPAPPVVPEEEHTSKPASDNFTTATISASRKELQQLTYQFNILVLRFKFPSNVEFTIPSKEGELPKLAHTPASKPFFEHTHKLEKMLEKVDEVESHGDKETQRMRKQAVDRMLYQIEVLKQLEAMALYNFNYERDTKV